VGLLSCYLLQNCVETDLQKTKAFLRTDLTGFQNLLGLRKKTTKPPAKPLQNNKNRRLLISFLVTTFLGFLILQFVPF
jgi:hypothetical protein